MVTSATIKRLADQIDALEARYQAKREFKTVFVICERGETSETAWVRHVAEHPEDADADVAITTLYEDAVPGDAQRARELGTRKAENLRSVGADRSVALVPRKSVSTEQWVSQWGKE